MHPLLDWVFRAVLWLSTGMRRQEWVAVHRKHHTFTDREGDPHSPMLLGFWKVQLFNVYYYAREAMAPDIVRKFAPDLVEDKWDRYVFSWGWSGLFLGTSIGVTWDVSCAAPSYHLLYGNLANVGTYALSGNVCGLGTSGSFNWNGVNAGRL